MNNQKRVKKVIDSINYFLTEITNNESFKKITSKEQESFMIKNNLSSNIWKIKKELVYLKRIELGNDAKILNILSSIPITSEEHKKFTKSTKSTKSLKTTPKAILTKPVNLSDNKNISNELTLIVIKGNVSDIIKIINTL